MRVVGAGADGGDCGFAANLEGWVGEGELPRPELRLRLLAGALGLAVVVVVVADGGGGAHWVVMRVDGDDGTGGWQ